MKPSPSLRFGDGFTRSDFRSVKLSPSLRYGDNFTSLTRHHSASLRDDGFFF